MGIDRRKAMSIHAVFESAQTLVQELHETMRWNLMGREIPDEPDWEDDVLYISNDMQVVESEKYALENWGKGKYSKFVAVENR